MADYFEPINDFKSSDDLTGNAFTKLFASESKRYKPGTQKILQSINKNLMESFELDQQTNRNLKMLQLQKNFFEKQPEIKTALQDVKTSNNNNNLFETKGYQEYKQYVDNTNSRPNSIPISAPNSNDY